MVHLMILVHLTGLNLGHQLEEIKVFGADGLWYHTYISNHALVLSLLNLDLGDNVDNDIIKDVHYMYGC